MGMLLKIRGSGYFLSGRNLNINVGCWGSFLTLTYGLSPVMAMRRTGRLRASESRAEAMVIPAEGPSLGVVPAGTRGMGILLWEP